MDSRGNARLGKKRGIPAQVLQKNGDLVRLAPGKPGKISEVRNGRLILDGDIISPADGEAIVMRRRLAQNGVVMVAIGASGSVQVAGLGLPLDEDYDAFVNEAQGDVAAALGKLKGAAKGDVEAVTEAARLAARLNRTRRTGLGGK